MVQLIMSKHATDLMIDSTLECQLHNNEGGGVEFRELILAVRKEEDLTKRPAMMKAILDDNVRYAKTSGFGLALLEILWKMMKEDAGLE